MDMFSSSAKKLSQTFDSKNAEGRRRRRLRRARRDKLKKESESVLAVKRKEREERRNRISREQADASKVVAKIANEYASYPSPLPHYSVAKTENPQEDFRKKMWRLERQATTRVRLLKRKYAIENAAKKSLSWSCPTCTLLNPRDVTSCQTCGRVRGTAVLGEDTPTLSIPLLRRAISEDARHLFVESDWVVSSADEDDGTPTSQPPGALFPS